MPRRATQAALGPLPSINATGARCKGILVAERNKSEAVVVGSISLVEMYIGEGPPCAQAPAFLYRLNDDQHPVMTMKTTGQGGAGSRYPCSAGNAWWTWTVSTREMSSAAPSCPLRTARSVILPWPRIQAIRRPHFSVFLCDFVLLVRRVPPSAEAPIITGRNQRSRAKKRPEAFAEGSSKNLD